MEVETGAKKKKNTMEICFNTIRVQSSWWHVKYNNIAGETYRKKKKKHENK